MSDETTDELRQRLYEVAEGIAPTWIERADFVEAVTAPVREWLLRELAPEPGQALLEVAAGMGRTGFEAAAVVGDGGRLVSTDLSPTLVEAARRRAGDLGLTNVEHRVADAAETGLEDDSVDGVICRYGYMLMADPAAALAEARRVLRPGGRLVLAVWGGPDRNPFFTTVVMALVQRGALPPPDPSGPGIFALADPGRLTGLLEQAGFDTVRTEDVAVTFEFADPAEYVAITADTAGPIGLALQGLDEGTRAALADALSEPLEPFRTDSGYEVPGVTLCAAAS